MISTLRRCCGCEQWEPADVEVDYQDLNRRDRQGERYLIKYQILTKDTWVITIYSLEDTTNACLRFINSGYRCIESGVPNYNAQLPHGLTCTTNIVPHVPDENTITIRPPDGKELRFEDLQKLHWIEHKVEILASQIGRQNLELRIKCGDEILQKEPFSMMVEEDQVYGATSVQQPQTRQVNRPKALPLKPGEPELRFLLARYDVENHWPLLEKAGITTVQQLESLNKQRLRDLGVSHLGDRIKLMKAVNNSKSAFVNVGYKPERKAPSNMEEFLNKIALNNLIYLFIKEKITYDVLIDMNEEDLKEIGVKEIDRKVIVQAAKEIPGYVYTEDFSEGIYDELID
uniref:uncharacterized protein LOC120328489 n=1 Tax=Styela clava TaxID=7725 RepID=UPI00193A5D3A|nr:uncharacterized protein LOC120328489 [Styela clava]